MREDWTHAHRKLKEVFQSDPNNTDLLPALCRKELKNPKWIPQTTQRFADDMKKHPAFEEGWILFAESCLARSLPARAAACLETVLRLNPSNQRARDMLRKIEQEKPR